MFPIPFNFPFRKKDGSVTTIDAAISGGGTPYTLPTASATVKGGVKIGNNLSMDGDTLNASGGGTIDTDNMKYIVGRVGDYEYYADLKRTYVGDAAPLSCVGIGGLRGRETGNGTLSRSHALAADRVIDEDRAGLLPEPKGEALDYSD